jgi:hypothetical protein
MSLQQCLRDIAQTVVPGGAAVSGSACATLLARWPACQRNFPQALAAV